jgi:hypothetical protein
MMKSNACLPYSWIAGSFGTCSAPQPAWQASGFGACSASQPAYTYSAWGACSKSCGGGTQTRTQSCPVVHGTQTQSVSCPVSNGTQTRTVQCQRGDGAIVDDSYCNAGSKPVVSQACSRNDCAGTAPPTSRACSRGGGSDCRSPQATSRACNTQACVTCSGLSRGGYCWYIGGNGQSCNTVCTSRGGVNAAGIINYVGSSGSLANCSAVLNALGFASATDFSIPPMFITGGLGCMNVSGTSYRHTNMQTTTDSSWETAARVCACNK